MQQFIVQAPMTNGARRSTSLDSNIPRVSPVPDASTLPAQSNNDDLSKLCDVPESDLSIDILASMLCQEYEYTPATFSSYGSPLADAPHPQQVLPVLYPEWRSKICDWAYRVVDHFRYDREVVGVAMNLFDRYSAMLKAAEEASSDVRLEFDVPDVKPMATATAVPPSPGFSARSTSVCSNASASSQEEEESKRYQLGAMTALFVAIKLHCESTPDIDEFGNEDHSRGTRRRKRRMKLLSFVELSRGQFDPKDISEMEKMMLMVLKWKVNPPTPTSFVGYFVKLIPKEHIRQYDLAMHVIHELSRYLTELSVCLTDVSTLYRPSWVAYSAMMISFESIRTDVLPMANRAAFFEAAARLSDKGHGNQCLSPDCKAVHYLKGRLRTTFLPEMLLDATTKAGGQVKVDPKQGHPIAIARDAGLLVDDLCNQLTSEMDHTTISPMPSFEVLSFDDDDDDDIDKAAAKWGQVQVHRRDKSATSVMDHEVVAVESTIHQMWSQ